jgi:hypothetical protein
VSKKLVQNREIYEKVTSGTSLLDLYLGVVAENKQLKEILCVAIEGHCMPPTLKKIS